LSTAGHRRPSQLNEFDVSGNMSVIRSMKMFGNEIVTIQDQGVRDVVWSVLWTMLYEMKN
jgi:hypothetical protein